MPARLTGVVSALGEARSDPCLPEWAPHPDERGGERLALRARRNAVAPRARFEVWRRMAEVAKKVLPFVSLRWASVGESKNSADLPVEVLARCMTAVRIRYGGDGGESLSRCPYFPAATMDANNGA